MERVLKDNTLKALSWSFVQEIVQRVLQFGVGVMLARMLAPAAFGLVAMLSVIFAVAQVILESGFAAALIQRKQPTDTDESSVFYFNILISLILASALWLAAPAVARFYNQPVLEPMMRVFMLVLVINAFTVVQSALLIRRLDFKQQAIIVAAGIGISGVIGLALAWRGFGVWSLVAQQVTNSLVRACLLWALSPWRPKWLFSVRSLREMFAFGSGMLASGLLRTTSESVLPLLIGKLFSVSELGYYNRAQTMQVIAAESLGTVAGRVTFPVFSGLQEEMGALRSALRKAITTIAFVQFPVLIGLACVAKPLVLLMLTEKWVPCVPYLQLLCLVGLLYPVHLLNLNVTLAIGRSDLNFRLAVIKQISTVLTILLTFHWGIIAMIWGLVFQNIFAYFLNAHYGGRLIGYPIRDQFQDFCPYLIASGLMGLGAYAVGLFFSHPWPTLLAQAFVGAVIYLSICRILRLSAFAEIRREVWALTPFLKAGLAN